MRLENLRRIRKGYSPKEPTTLLEKGFYLLWVLGIAVMVLLWGGWKWACQMKQGGKKATGEGKTPRGG